MQALFDEELAGLNPEQRQCVMKSALCGANVPANGGGKLGSGAYHMVLGTPGSGKTTAIVALIKVLAKMKQRVLLVNFTNQAIDNVLVRLKE